MQLTIRVVRISGTATNRVWPLSEAVERGEIPSKTTIFAVLGGSFLMVWRVDKLPFPGKPLRSRD